MTDRITLDLRNVILGAMALLMASLTYSVYAMSVSQFLLAGAWILDGTELPAFKGIKSGTKTGKVWSWLTGLLFSAGKNLIQKFRDFFTNRVALIFASVFFMHVAGVLYSSDIAYALKDLRTKIPLFIIPLFLSTIRPVEKNEYRFLLQFYVLAVVVNSWISTWVLVTQQPADTRNIALYVSHIRFGLNIVLALSILAFMAYERDFLPAAARIAAGILAFWLFLFLFLLQSFSGFLALAAVVMGLGLIWLSRSSNLKNKVAGIVFFLLLAFVGSWQLRTVIRSYTVAAPVNFQNLPTHTMLGNPYTHDTISLGIEHGRYVCLFLQWEEMRRAWNERSTMDFDGSDTKGNELKYTLLRYLNSKNLTKDAAGISFLSERDIRYIEQGVADFKLTGKLNIRSKLGHVIQGYLTLARRQDPNANTLLQRLEYWKTSLWIIGHHPLAGVGTGDMNLAFSDAYDKLNSKLRPEMRWRSHNQFLSITVGFGILGLAWFVFAFLYPVVRLKGYRNYLFMASFLISISSMLVEDTIETQAGVTFFVVFYCLFLFHPLKSSTLGEKITGRPSEQNKSLMTNT